jgi:thiamine kinase-like enzyme
MSDSRFSPLPPELIRDLEPFTGVLLEVVPINGGMTNRNFRLETENGRFMLRLAGEHTALLGINRDHEFTSASIAHQLGVGVEAITYLERHAAILTRFIGAETLTVETATKHLEQLVKTVKRYHQAPVFPAQFNPFETVKNYHKLALEYGVKFPEDLPWVLTQMNRIETALQTHARETACHNDLLPANLLFDGSSIFIVDWEYAGNGNPFFDLGNLAVNLELDIAQCKYLLELYFGFSSPKLLAQLQLMRLASDLREAFWGFLQAGISSLEFDFMGYGEKHLERFRSSVTMDEYEWWLKVLSAEV